MDAQKDKIQEGDLVRVWETREGVVVGRYGDGYYEVLVRLPHGRSLVRACREQDLILVQHPAADV